MCCYLFSCVLCLVASLIIWPQLRAWNLLLFPACFFYSKWNHRFVVKVWTFHYLNADCSTMSRCLLPAVEAANSTGTYLSVSNCFSTYDEMAGSWLSFDFRDFIWSKSLLFWKQSIDTGAFRPGIKMYTGKWYKDLEVQLMILSALRIMNWLQ